MLYSMVVSTFFSTLCLLALSFSRINGVSYIEPAIFETPSNLDWDLLCPLNVLKPTEEFGPFDAYMDGILATEPGGAFYLKNSEFVRVELLN